MIGEHVCGEVRWGLLVVILFGPGVGIVLLSIACVCVSVQVACPLNEWVMPIFFQNVILLCVCGCVSRPGILNPET